MHSTYLIATLCGVAIAQKLNIKAVDELELPSALGPDAANPTFVPAAYDSQKAAEFAASSVLNDGLSLETVVEEVIFDRRDGLRKRNDCSPETPGLGPVPGDGSVASYQDSANSLHSVALAALPPNGYEQNFINVDASTQQVGYLTYKSLSNGSYNIPECAAFCDSVQLCMAFNVWYERDPSITPAAACPNPAPVTNAKCALYGYPVSRESATNVGQYRGPQDANGQAFQVVVIGSNGYSKSNSSNSSTPGAFTNFTGPSELLNGAIFAPLVDGNDTYLGMRLYNNGPYDPSLCAATCQATTAYDQRHPAADGTYQPCNFFNAFILSKNDVSQGTYCAFYSRAWDPSYATNTGYKDGDDTYTVTSSYSYTLTTLDPGHI
ncbi:hypothetical protein K491DRAFT_753220 [Lophiostoma macrostomum CBS 122681]|uniref:Apple domain-containing protein n=1 Tax=Lophiostoma macrostomum CBS 122681 TaxID=1314788 RepID=A0A6A6TU30_9PLEO|nr:hypothetical protein K491DRAFT_753220 [Lophiostoma macrostomum CBS 122681]